MYCFPYSLCGIKLICYIMTSRRDLLRQIGAVGSVGGMTSLAGCTNPFSDPNSDDGSDNSDEEKEEEEEESQDEGDQQGDTEASLSSVESNIDRYFDIFTDAKSYIRDDELSGTNWEQVRDDIEYKQKQVDELDDAPEIYDEVLEFCDWTAQFYEEIEPAIKEYDDLVSAFTNHEHDVVHSDGFGLIKKFEDIKINSHRARQVLDEVEEDTWNEIDVVSYSRFSTLSSETHRNANSYETSVVAVTQTGEALYSIDEGSEDVDGDRFIGAEERFDDAWVAFGRAKRALNQLQDWSREVHLLNWSRRGLQCQTRAMEIVSEDYLLDSATSAQGTYESDGSSGDYSGENEIIEEGIDDYNQRCSHDNLEINWPQY